MIDGSKQHRHEAWEWKRKVNKKETDLSSCIHLFLPSFLSLLEFKKSMVVFPLTVWSYMRCATLS